LDAENFISGVEGVNVSMILNPLDPLLNQTSLSTTDSFGNYFLTFPAI